MDLFGQYGSDNEGSEQDQQQQQQQPEVPSTKGKIVGGLLSSLPRPSGASAKDTEDLLELELGAKRSAGASGGGIFSSLPKAAAGGASGSSAGLLSSLPAPGSATAGLPAPAGGKKVVQLVRNIDPKMLYDSDEDDDLGRPAKKAKTQAGGAGGPSTFASLLPAPQGQYTSGNKRAAQLDIGDDSKEDAGMRIQGPGASTSHPPAGYVDSNEMYRVTEDGGYYDYSAYYAQQQQQPVAGPSRPAVPVIPGIDLSGLDPKIVEQIARDAKRKGGSFTEIKAETIQYVPPGRAEVNDAIKVAYGDNYEAKIRAEAGPDPGKKAKSKHQISSLYHQAKLAEVEMLEQRANSMKTIQQTRSKYGWR